MFTQNTSIFLFLRRFYFSTPIGEAGEQIGYSKYIDDTGYGNALVVSKLIIIYHEKPGQCFGEMNHLAF